MIHTFFSMAQEPLVGQGLFYYQGFTIRLKTHHTRQNSSGRMISLTGRHLTPHNTRDRHLCPQRYSNPQFHQASSRGPNGTNHYPQMNETRGAQTPSATSPQRWHLIFVGLEHEICFVPPNWRLKF